MLEEVCKEAGLNWTFLYQQAGVFTSRSRIRFCQWCRCAFGVNYLAPYEVLRLLLMPLMKKADAPRIIILKFSASQAPVLISALTENVGLGSFMRHTPKVIGVERCGVFIWSTGAHQLLLYSKSGVSFRYKMAKEALLSTLVPAAKGVDFVRI